MGKKTPQRTRRDYYADPEAPEVTSRRPSASVVVRDGHGQVLLLQRKDNGLWTIPTGGLKKNESMRQCAVRECAEETGLVVEVTGLVGVFSDPAHVIAYYHGKKLDEVRQPVNVCFHARLLSAEIHPSPKEAQEVRWVRSEDIDELPIHEAIRRRLIHGLSGETDPWID